MVSKDSRVGWVTEDEGSGARRSAAAQEEDEVSGEERSPSPSPVRRDTEQDQGGDAVWKRF